MSELTPAEEFAAEQGLPIALVTPFELMRIATGNPMVVGTLTGGKVLVRLPSSEEYVAEVERAQASMPPGSLLPPVPTVEQAYNLVKPLTSMSA
jgi:hypothetical protein